MDISAITLLLSLSMVWKMRVVPFVASEDVVLGGNTLFLSLWMAVFP
jgi:hypothetical protein